jgi:hypothetical protein
VVIGVSSAAAKAHRRQAVPWLVGVDRQVHAAVDQLVHRGDTRQVGLHVGLTDLDLDAADATPQ